MLSLTCLCGRVRIDLARRPDFIHACNCTLCSKSGAYWGYFDPAELSITGDTLSYSREDRGEPTAAMHFCGRCGTTTHFTLTPGAIARVGNTMAGVNMRLADERDLAGVELRFPDGRAWAGSGEFGYVRPPSLLGGSSGLG